MNSLEKAQKVAELAQERLILLERLGECEKELVEAMSGTGNSTYQVSSTQVSAVGRPRGRPRKDGIIPVDGKDIPGGLPSLLVKIAQEHKDPLSWADFVTKARESGYESQAKDFPNMVYQALLKLVQKGVLEKDAASRQYHLVSKAA